MSGTDQPIVALLFAWAMVDLLQIPLVGTVFLSFRLARRVGGASKAAAICFAGYASWVIVTARFVPFAPSAWAVFLFGMILDPRREASPQRVWILGSAVALVVFWALPVYVASRFGRRLAGRSGGTLARDTGRTR